MNNQYCVIMAGGIGSRFWPMSTEKTPKQFLDILGTGRTMIQQTFDRISKIIPAENIFVITNENYISLCREQLPLIQEKNIVGEPMMKNTAACNLYMAKKIHAQNPNANIIILPADHLILYEDKFIEKINLAFDLARENDFLITLGITPTRPDTGYGYIQYLANEDKNFHQVKTFTEKPDLEIAKSFLESGDFLWNAGIFIWNTQAILSAFEKFLPEMTQLFENIPYNTPEEAKEIANIYPKINKISIDNGILEKANNVYVIPADLGWSDLGTWTSVYENSTKDPNQNTLQKKDIILKNSSGNVIKIHHNEKKAVIDGLENFIVIDTPEALLICPRANDQLIKNYVSELKKSHL